MYIVQYNRQRAIEYAHKWAYSRNPKYFNFEGIGGDCTNFISQCIFAGNHIMNYTPTFGWYYINGNNKSPSWTGVKYLYNFLTTNRKIGPFAIETNIKNIIPGDVIQIGFNETSFHHSLFVVSIGSPISINNILIATHTYDSDNRPLATYDWEQIRFIHILGVRK